MSFLSYSEKHKRSVSPILKTTTEDRKILHHNKENYIQYLEHQLEKTATIVHKKYEERMRSLETVVKEHEDKFTNFIKVVKLLQNFAESQELENGNIKRYVNTTMEQLYHNELRTINSTMHGISCKVDELSQVSFREQPVLQEFEQSVNRKIDVMMDEIKQSALKTDYQQLEQRLSKFENAKKLEQTPKIQEADIQFNSTIQQQLIELKLLLDHVLREQEAIKTNVQNIHYDLNQQKASASTLPQRLSRKSEMRESQQSEQESVMKPKMISREEGKTETIKQNTASKSKSKSEPKINSTEPKKKKKTIVSTKSKQKNAKSNLRLKY